MHPSTHQVLTNFLYINFYLLYLKKERKRKYKTSNLCAIQLEGLLAGEETQKYTHRLPLSYVFIRRKKITGLNGRFMGDEGTKMETRTFSLY